MRLVRTHLSLFSGIGGFDLAAERAGCRTVLCAESDKHCQAVLHRHWPDVPILDDVRSVDGKIKAYIISGGFPCQDISVAGRRAGLAGERSGLWWEFHRILAATLPVWTIIENVTGLLSSNGGRDMGAILGALGDLGYGYAYRVLDAQYCGVAQRRRRVFIVGCLGNMRRAAEVLLESESLCGYPAPSREARKEITDALTGRAGSSGDYDGSGRYVVARIDNLGSNGCGVLEDGTTHTLGGAQDVVCVRMREECAGGGKGPLVSKNKSLTLATGNDQFLVSGLSENMRGELRLTDYSCTLAGGGGKPGQGYAAALIGTAVRRLTPTEYERLQGFPDGWTEGHSDSQRYKMLGNAVAVPVVQRIIERIVKPIPPRNTR